MKPIAYKLDNDLCFYQVVSGLLYKFDLVSTGACGDTGVQGVGTEEEVRCHMEVYTVPWRRATEVLWDKSTCTRSGPSRPDNISAQE